MLVFIQTLFLKTFIFAEEKFQIDDLNYISQIVAKYEKDLKEVSGGFLAGPNTIYPVLILLPHAIPTILKCCTPTLEQLLSSFVVVI